MKALTAVAVSMALSAVSLAAPVAHADDPGPYVGGGFGRGHIGFDGGSFASNSSNVNDSTDTGKTGEKLFLGVNLDRHWAVEGGYTHFGSFKYNYAGANAIATTSKGQASYGASSWWLAGKGAVPLTDRFDLYGKLGLAENKTRDSASSNDPALDAVLGTPYTRNSNHTGLLAGLGAEYHPGKKVGVRVEFDDYGKFGSSGSRNLAHLGMWTADLAYHF